MVKELAIKILKTLVENPHYLRIECDGFTTHYDMSGQRSAYLINTFKDQNFDKLPLYFGVVRSEYLAVDEGSEAILNVPELKFWPNGMEYFSAKDKKLIYLGSLSVTEKLLEWATVEINHYGAGFIKFGNTILNFKCEKLAVERTAK